MSSFHIMTPATGQIYNISLFLSRAISNAISRFWPQKISLMTIHWSQSAYQVSQLVYGLVCLNKHNLKFYASYNRAKVWWELNYQRISIL